MPSPKTFVALATLSLVAACTATPKTTEAPRTERKLEASPPPRVTPSKQDDVARQMAQCDAGSPTGGSYPQRDSESAPSNPEDTQPTYEYSLDEMGGVELAQMLASKILADELPRGDGLPRARSASDNNVFALVRSSADMAKETFQVIASHDGKRMAYLPSQADNLRSLWVANVDSTDARELVSLSTSEATLPEGGKGMIPSDSIFSPSFSADDEMVYFQADGWATSAALYSVDLKTGAIRFVADANGYEVIGECRDKSLVGSIIAYRHSYSELPLGAVDWFFLLGRTGKTRGVIGPSEENVERFLLNRCGYPQRVTAVPPELERRPGCNDFVLIYRPKRLLDGTELPFFFAVPADKADRPFESLDSEDVGVAFDVDEAKSVLLDQCGIEVQG